MKITILRQKSFLSILITFIIIMTSCGDQPSVANQSKNTPVQVSAASSRKYKISWTMYQNQPVPKDAEMIKYIENKFNVELDIWNLENKSYESLLELRLASGDIPDLFRIRQPQDLLKYKNQGVLAVIPDEVLFKNAHDIIATIEANAPSYLKYGKIDDKYYGIPVINPTNIYRIPVVYRKDWLDKLGLPVPDTLQEFEKTIYAFSRNDPDGNGKKDTYGLSKEGINVVFGAFGQIVFADQLYFNIKNQKLVIGAIEPEMKEALKYLQKWYKDGIIDPEFVTGENNGGYKHLSHAFINGRIGMTSMGNYYHWIQSGDYMEADKDGKEVPVSAAFNALELSQKNKNARIVFGQPFSGPAGKRGSKAYNLLMSFTAIGYNAAKEPGKMEKILQILDYVSANPAPDIYISMQQGIEGKHWKWSEKSSEQITILPPYDKMFSYTNTIGASIGMTVPRKQKSRREHWVATLGLDKNGIYNAMEVATPSIMQKSEELIKLKNAAYISIITGDKPVDYFDTFVKEFLAEGGKKLLDEANN